MTADRDDDEAALSWGDADASHVDAKVEPATVEVREAPSTEKPAVPGMLLITYGVLAGIFLIYTIGWVITVSRSGPASTELLVELMAQLREFLAIASPALWFATVFLLTRGRKPLVRLLLLILGLVVVLPWPFVLGV